ncbi:MAG: hypothetical protein CV087_10435 [Candidatus Brocadia sp. WS118]|nr:MAG: hypothetical protein CV087_10435 [Candidatus Brocadia sp. WS118]
MKKWILFWGVISLTTFSLAQMPWSAPAPLTDTTANNLQPAFVKDINEFGDIFNMLIWQRDFGDRSRIFFKSFENPLIEIPVSPDLAGIYAANPSAAFVFNYPDSAYVLIVWQSNRNGNEDLFSVVFQNGQFDPIVQITTDTLDDIHPDVRNNYLVWERGGNILFSEYSYTDSTWTGEIVLDSMNASHPVVSHYYNNEPLVAYEKDLLIYLKERVISQGWQPSEAIVSSGENRLPQLVPGWRFSILWQYRQNELEDWDIMSYDPQWQTTGNLNFGPGNETNVQGVEFLWITKGDFDPPTLIAFESDIDGNPEIYANEPLFGPLVNLSQYPGVDSLPAVSDFSFAEAQTLQFRVWCAWQKFLNDKWQVWGSFTELDWVEGISDPSSLQEINSFKLFQNYPNPFNPVTNLRFRIADFGLVELSIFDITGQRVRTLVKSKMAPGNYTYQWDGRDDAGSEVASGVYIYRLKTENQIISRKMALLR